MSAKCSCSCPHKDDENQKADVMFYFNLQTFFLLAIAYLVGTLVGCWLRKMFSESASKLHHTTEDLATAAVPATAAASTSYAGDDGEASIKISRGSGHVIDTRSVPTPKPESAVYYEAPVERESITVRDPAPVEVVAAPLVVPEPIPEPVSEPEPISVPEPEPVVLEEMVVTTPPAPLKDDDLTRIKGIGLPVALELKRLGVTRFEQVARWTDADVAEVSRRLNFSGRIERENWMEQANILASGRELEFTDHQLRDSEGNQNQRIRGERSRKGGTSQKRTQRRPVRRGDDFRMISGIDSHIARQLNDLGIIHYSQIANWTPAEVAAIGRRLNVDEQRIDRENWLAQARQLSASRSN